MLMSTNVSPTNRQIKVATLFEKNDEDKTRQHGKAKFDSVVGYHGNDGDDRRQKPDAHKGQHHGHVVVASRDKDDSKHVLTAQHDSIGTLGTLSIRLLTSRWRTGFR